MVLKKPKKKKKRKEENDIRRGVVDPLALQTKHTNEIELFTIHLANNHFKNFPPNLGKFCIIEPMFSERENTKHPISIQTNHQIRKSNNSIKKTAAETDLRTTSKSHLQ